MASTPTTCRSAAGSTILLSNLKTSTSGPCHSLNFDKEDRRYLGVYCFRFNNCFAMAVVTERSANSYSLSQHALQRPEPEGRGG